MYANFTSEPYGNTVNYQSYYELYSDNKTCGNRTNSKHQDAQINCNAVNYAANLSHGDSMSHYKVGGLKLYWMIPKQYSSCQGAMNKIDDLQTHHNLPGKESTGSDHLKVVEMT
jgi:hypothetical protein